MRFGTAGVGEKEQEAAYIFGSPGDDVRLDRSAVESQHGFTLVEMVTVIVIIGILAVAAVPRFFDNDVFQARGTADQVIAALRYGQKVAIAQHSPVIVQVTKAAKSDCGAVLEAGLAVNCVILNGVAFNQAIPWTVTFNALGQRVPNAATSAVVGTTTIIIEAETGYVH